MTTKQVSDTKSCFFISPIGEENSETRSRSNKVEKFIINPVITDLGYSEATRADKINKSGLISNQVIERIYNDDLVVVDLTDHNPNVFYELAIRHMVNKPIIHIIECKQSIPFDINQQRTIMYDLSDLENVEKCQLAMKQQIQEMKDDPAKIDNPIKIAIDTLKIKQDHESSESKTIVILEKMSNDLLYRIESIRKDFEDSSQRNFFFLDRFQAVMMDLLRNKNFIENDNNLNKSKMVKPIKYIESAGNKAKFTGTYSCTNNLEHRMFVEKGDIIPPCPVCNNEKFYLLD